MKTFLNIDYHIQTLLLFFMGITLPLVIIPLFLLIIFGGWQLLSGLITAFCYKELKRDKYLIKALGYLLFLFTSYQLAEANLLPDALSNSTALAFLFWIIIPLGIGIWYYIMVNTDYHKYCKEKEVMNNTTELNSPLVVK